MSWACDAEREVWEAEMEVHSSSKAVIGIKTAD